MYLNVRMLRVVVKSDPFFQFVGCLIWVAFWIFDFLLLSQKLSYLCIQTALLFLVLLTTLAAGVWAVGIFLSLRQLIVVS